MKLDVVKLGDGKEVIFRESWDPIEHELDVPGREYKSALGVEALVRRDSGVVRAKIVLRSILRLTCSRCQKDIEKDFEQVLDLIYPVDLSNRIIEFDEDIRGELILNYPQKTLCRFDCPGLCAGCGADLNEEKCRCDI